MPSTNAARVTLRVAAAAVFALLAREAPCAGVVGTGTAASCTQAALDTALTWAAPSTRGCTAFPPA